MRPCEKASPDATRAPRAAGATSGRSWRPMRWPQRERDAKRLLHVGATENDSRFRVLTCTSVSAGSENARWEVRKRRRG
jgi:hypothetical protein